MTKRSTRVASFIMAIVMLLVSVLFTEFGTIKVSAAAADGDISLSGSSYPSSGWGARQDYAIRVFPIPAGLKDNYTTTKVDKIRAEASKITANGWNASLPGGTFGAYRTNELSVWVFPRKDTTANEPTMYTGYTGGSFKGYSFTSLDNVIDYDDIKDRPDVFEALFANIAFSDVNNSHIADVEGSNTSSDLASTLNTAIAKYRKSNSANNNSLLNAMKSHIKNSNAKKTLTSLMNSSQVTLAFEIYIGAGKNSQTTQMFSVTALQDYAKAIEGSAGAFSNTCKFSNAPDGSYRYALWYAFGIAFNALMPGYFTSETWYTQASPTSYNITLADGKTKVGGGGWCFYSFKTVPTETPPSTPTTPTTADLTLYFNKSITMSGAGAKPTVEVKIMYAETPYSSKNYDFTKELAAFEEAVPKADRTQADITKGMTLAYKSRINDVKKDYKAAITKNRKATVTYKGLNVKTTKTTDKTVYYIPVYEFEVISGARYMGTWGTKPAGLIRAEYAYNNKTWGWKTSYSPLYQIETGSGFGTSSQTADRTITFVNTYKTRGRNAISLNYGNFTINQYDRFNLTYKKGSWTGSALDGESRLVYTTAIKAGSGSTFRLASGSSEFLQKQSDPRDLADYTEAAWRNNSETKTINMPEKGTVYTRGNSNIRVNVLSGKTTSFKVSNDSLALLNATGIYSTSVMTKEMLGYSYDTTVSRRLVADKGYDTQVYMLQEGKTYSFNVSDDRKPVTSSTDVAKELNAFGNYSAYYALYEGAIARNYSEFELYLNYYAKQFVWLRSQAVAATDTKTRDGYLTAMKSLTGYDYSWDSKSKTITTSAPSGATLVNLYGYLEDANGNAVLCHNYIAVTKGYPELKKPTSTSTMGKWFSKAVSFAKTLVALDEERPAASITAMTNYTYTDEGKHFQTAKAPEYYLSMNWGARNFLLNKNTAYTRNTIYDFNATPGLSGYPKTTADFSAPAMQYNNHVSYFRPLYLRATKTTSALEADLTTASKYSATAYSMRSQLNANINLDSGEDKVAVTLYGSTFSGGTLPAAFNNSITTSYDYNVFSTYWKVAGSNTKGVYLPSADYAKAFFGKDDIASLATAFSAKRANKGTNTATQKLTGTASLRIAHSNIIKEWDPVSYDVFEHHAALPAGNTCFIAGVSNPRSSTTMSLTPTVNAKKDNNNASWSAQSVVNKLSVEFTAFKSAAKTKKTITAGTSTDKNKGWFERTSFSVYPLVKMAYQTQNVSTLKYTYIVGSTARTIPATTYYTVSIKSANNDTPVATALALASDSRALTLSKRLTGNTKTPVAYSGTGVQVSASGSTTLEFKAYSLINADSGKDYQKEWGNTAESGNILSKLLADNKLGFKTETITQNGKTYSGIAYSSAYTAKLGEKTWDMKSNTGGYALSTGNSTSVTMPIKVAGGQVVSITIPKEYKGGSDATTIRVSDSDLNKAITNGTLPLTTFILNTVKNVKTELYDALIKMGITGKTDTDILYNAFAHNEGAEVVSDANGKKADGLLLGGGKNWYNEYCNCLAIRVETMSYSLNNKPVIDKIPIEAGPAQPADKSKYFTNGYGFSVTALKIKIGDKTLTFNYSGAQPQFIVSNVPVTAAH